MSFTRDYQMLLHKSCDNICKIDLEDGVKIYNYDERHRVIYEKKILDGNYGFIDCHFDIDKSDNIYGVVNDRMGNLYYIFITDEIVVKSRVLKYNEDLYTIKNPYIKRQGDKIVVVFYLLDKRSPEKVDLVFYYYKEDKWVKYQVDEIRYYILTDFNVIFNNDSVDFFYFNNDEVGTELYVSSFSFKDETLSQPINITNNMNLKVYLSVIKDSEDFYHIVYSENNNSKYYCKYINLTYFNGHVKINNEVIISKTIACEFPSVLKYNDYLFVFWSEYKNLYKSFSTNNGGDFSRAVMLSNFDDEDFSRVFYSSNNNLYPEIMVNTMFLKKSSINIYGFLSSKELTDSRRG